MKYYAVKYQNEKNLFTSWDACKEYLKHKKGFSQKSFLSLEEANSFLEDKEIPLDFAIPTAYIDGSYDAKTGCYSFGGVLLWNDQEYQFSKKYEPDQYSSSRNVAGEIKGAGYILQYACNHGIQEINLIYDYAGIEKWYTGEWQANSGIAVAYTTFRDQVKNKIKVNFIKVKSHSNDKYNDLADTLAKKALGI